MWLVHKMFGQWGELLQERRIRDGFPYLDGLWLYVQGSAYVGRGEIERAKEALSLLQELQLNPTLETIISRFNPVSKVLKIATLGLEGEIKQAEGNLEGAIAAFETAVQTEDELSYIEPPDWAQPMRHYLGAALLEAGRAAEAEQIYRQDLTWNQNNGWSLFGLWQSLEAQGRIDDAREVADTFQEAWKNADVELSRSRF
ncbi:MAG: tetratricopeptide repeat protein [Pseudomonadota bacterium]